MKKFNQCLGIAGTRAEADALVTKLGRGHPVKSGSVWRVMTYPPGEVGKNSIYSKDWRKPSRGPSNTEGK